MNTNYFDLYRVPSTLFFLFKGYFSVQNIQNFLQLHPIIVIALKLLGMVLIICLVFYLSIDVVHAMGPEESDLPKPGVKVTTGDVSNC